jgi:hypothetical protein
MDDIGARLGGSPTPKLITGFPSDCKCLAISFMANVGDDPMDRARLLIFIKFLYIKSNF